MARPISPRVVLDGVSRRFGDHVALDRVSLTVEPGEFVAVVGRSGAGKTTLIRCLARSLVATEGAIRCGGSDVGALRGRRCAPTGPTSA
jgi:ABC-type multidrug transport system ATPase subunit